MTIHYSSPLPDGDDPFRLFEAATPAPPRQPLPGGVYLACTEQGEMVRTSRGSDGYRITFKITEPPEFAGRTLIRTWTFGPRAISYTRRDLADFGLNSGADLLAPFPRAFAYTCRLVVALQRADSGEEMNDVKRITVVTKTPLSAHPYGVDLGGNVAKPARDAGAEVSHENVANAGEPK